MGLQPHTLETLYELLDHEGVEDIHVEITANVTVKKRNTGEVDDRFNEIRERSISEEEIESLVEDTEWGYHGTVDVVGDFRLRDKLSLSTTLEE